MGIGRGKLLLFGEHAAVYGHPALGIATADTTEVTVRPEAPEPVWTGSVDTGDSAIPLSITGVPDAYLSVLRDAVAATIRAASIAGAELATRYPQGLHVTVRSSIPPGSGFGSSAALCVALATALAGSGIARDAELWRIANTVERIFHGTPSGIDTGLSLSTGLTAVYPAPTALPEKQPVSAGPFALVYGGVPRIGDTKSLVARVRAGMDTGSPAMVDAIDALGSISRSAISICATDSPAETMGELCNEAQEHLRRIGLSTDSIEQRLARARETGAIGGKLSGAGGGGAWYAVYASADAAHAGYVQLRQALPAGERELLRVVCVSGSDVRAVE